MSPWPIRPATELSESTDTVMPTVPGSSLRDSDAAFSGPVASPPVTTVLRGMSVTAAWPTRSAASETAPSGRKAAGTSA